MYDKKFKELAEVIIKKGVVLDKGQILVIQASVEASYFVRMVADVAFKTGASEVFIDWYDDEIDKLRYKNESIKTWTNVYPILSKIILEYSKKNCCFVKITTPDPDIFSDIPVEILNKVFKIKSQADEEITTMKMNGTCKWISLAVPSRKWAKKVFPYLKEYEAYGKFLDIYFEICRIEEEMSVLKWNSHIENLTDKANFLTDKNLVKLHFKNGLGTDLMIELAKNHRWVGGTLHSKSGTSFVPNIPTEEIATAPHKDGVNGTVISTKPLVHNGQIIDKFKLYFKDGKVINFDAEIGHEHLKHIIEADGSSCCLGEVALVPFDSPISNKDILFYNTLFDENASCHLALGRGYPVVIKNNDKMNDEDILKTGLNTKSMIHVDFMIGSEDLDVIGYDENDNAIQIFIDGNWAF